MFKSKKKLTINDYCKKIDILDKQIREYSFAINVLSNRIAFEDRQLPTKLLLRRRNKLQKIRDKLLKVTVKEKQC